MTTVDAQQRGTPPDDTPPAHRPVSLLAARAIRIVPLGLVQSVLAVALGLVICLLLILGIADKPWTAFHAFTLGTFQNTYSFGTMIAIATVLALTGLASAVGFRAGAFNIGGEGQVVLGGLACALVAQHLGGTGGVVQLVALLASAATGALWISVPTYLRVKYHTNEILTTLMMNYIAANLTLYLVNNHFKDPTSGATETPPLRPAVWLGSIMRPSQANIGVFIVLGIALITWIVFDRTRIGRRMEAGGLQPAFAEYLGTRSSAYLSGSMLVSGALAGLAGGIAILGITHTYIDGFSPQYGFLGITVALIGRLRPIGILVSALLYASLTTGATEMQQVSNVPYALVFTLQGILILLITSQGLFRRRA